MPTSHAIRAAALALWLASPASALDVVGTYDTTGTASDVERANGLVVLADGTAGIRIFDVSVPSMPTQLGSYNTPGNGARLSVDGTRIYVADGFSGMRILDATNPSAPVSLGVLATGGLVDDVLAHGNVVYLVDRFEGFLVVDVSNPAAPVVVGALPSLTNYRNISRFGDAVYISSLLAVNKKRIDVTNPAAPINLGDTSTTMLLEADGTIYRNNQDGVVVSGSQFTVSTLSNVIDFDAFDHFVVDATSLGNVEIWDFSGPFEPDAVELSSVSTSGLMQDVHVLAGRAYLARGGETSGPGSLEIHDVVDPANPILLGTVYDGISLHDVKAVKSGEQTLAYAASLFGGLFIADVTNPAAPVELGSYDSVGHGEGIDVVGSVAYLAAGTEGLLIIDVANPNAPALLAAVDTPGEAEMVIVRDGIAWVADDSSRTVRIIDVANPASPVPIGTIFAPGADVLDLALDGDLLYVAAAHGGLRIFNVANPAAPIPLGMMQDFQVWSLALAGRTVWLNALSGTGLVEVDVTDPMDPTPVARAPGGTYGRFAAAGNLVFAPGTFRIWDGSSVVSLHHEAALLDSLPGSAAAITVDPVARKAYVASGADGLRVVDLAGDLAALPCRNTDDDDGDGLVDAADPGCKTWDDPSEKADCDDGIDQDGDGLTDYPADPGCRNTTVYSLEDPQCQDGVDNEGDGATDHPADARCQTVWDDDEVANPNPSCGLGAELIGLAFVPLWRRRVRIRRSRP